MAKTTIRRPVLITAIMTPELREALAEELQAAADEVDRTNEAIEAEVKRVLAQHRDLQQAMALRQRVEREKQRQQAVKDEILKRRDEVLALQDGDEVVRGQAEGVVEVTEGDNLEEILAGAEIVTKDGVVVEIRETRKPVEERVDVSSPGDTGPSLVLGPNDE